MADNLDEVFAQPMEAEEPTPNQEPEAAVEPTPETVEEPTPPTQPEVEQHRPEPGYVPLNAVLEERERRQAAERRIAEFEAQAKPQEVPDPFDDPAGYQRHFEAQLDQRLQAQRADMSYQFAVREHGKDKVEEARAWAMEKAKSDPVFNQQVGVVFQTEASPVDWVVQQHQRDALLSDIGGNVDDWFTREAAKRGYVAQNAPAPAAPAAIPPASPPVKVPRSLATQGSGPSDVRQTATGALAGVDSLFS